jgi:hypothetical protein
MCLHAAVVTLLQEDRETLRDQLRAAPAEGDPNDMAINIAKVRPAMQCPTQAFCCCATPMNQHLLASVAGLWCDVN